MSASSWSSEISEVHDIVVDPEPDERGQVMACAVTATGVIAMTLSNN